MGWVIGLISFLFSMDMSLWIAMSQAQKIEVPVKLQIPLFLKILTFDRNLKARVGDEIVIGIVYQKKFRTSLNVKDEFANTMEELAVKSLKDIPIRSVSIDIDDQPDLARAISRDPIDILYITPLRAMEIRTIAAISRAKQVITLTGVPDYVESGIAVGLGIKDNKPQIIINLQAAKAEGADFNSQLLSLSKVIK